MLPEMVKNKENGYFELEIVMDFNMCAIMLPATEVGIVNHFTLK